MIRKKKMKNRYNSEFKKKKKKKEKKIFWRINNIIFKFKKSN